MRDEKWILNFRGHKYPNCSFREKCKFVVFESLNTHSDFIPFIMDLGAVFERSRENSLAFTLSLLLQPPSDVFEMSLWFFDFCGPLATYTLSLLLFMSPRTPIMYHAKYTRYKKNKTNKDFVLNDKICFQNITGLHTQDRQ